LSSMIVWSLISTSSLILAKTSGSMLKASDTVWMNSHSCSFWPLN
jgi:hypothetical protein